MFAIIEDGSRQYRVEVGDNLVVDFRDGTENGQALKFEKVLLVNTESGSTIGRPVVAGATVTGEIVHALFKGPKLEIQKFRRRKNYRRHTGHRQKHTVVKITSIEVANS
jgi:large subunit ribosomal protein L21